MYTSYFCLILYIVFQVYAILSAAIIYILMKSQTALLNIVQNC